MSLSIQNPPPPFNCLVVGLNVSIEDDLIKHLLSHNDILEAHNFKYLRKCSLLKSEDGMPDEAQLTSALSEQQPDLIVLAYEVQRPLNGVDTILHDHLRDRLRDVTPIIIYADINVSASKINFQDDTTRSKLHGQMEEFCKRVFTHTKIKDKYWAAVVVKRHHVRSKNFETTIIWAHRIAREVAKRRRELAEDYASGRLSGERNSARLSSAGQQRSRQHSRRISVDVAHPFDTDSLLPDGSLPTNRIRYDSSVGSGGADRRRSSAAPANIDRTSLSANSIGGKRYFEHQFRQEVLDNLRQLIQSFDKQSIANWSYNTNSDGFVEEIRSEVDGQEKVPLKYKLPRPVAEHLVKSLLTELKDSAAKPGVSGGLSTSNSNRTGNSWQ